MLNCYVLSRLMHGLINNYLLLLIISCMRALDLINDPINNLIFTDHLFHKLNNDINHELI